MKEDDGGSGSWASFGIAVSTFVKETHVLASNAA
jgi:hypothetical protein